MEECEYCLIRNDKGICGRTIRNGELIPTAGYRPERNIICYKESYNADTIERLELFILKGAEDEKAGLMIENISGARYIDINYCPMCGRKLG